MGDAAGTAKFLITVSVLIFLLANGFFIYFVFKIIQFVIQATNLYKKMIVRQDATIKLLLDIRDNTKNYSVEQKPLEEFTIIKNPIGDAYCCVCHKTSPMNGMYHHRATDTYYHKECLPNLLQPAPNEKPSVQPDAQQPAQPTVLFCAQCGERLEPGIAFCPNCGTKVEAFPVVSGSTQQSTCQAG